MNHSTLLEENKRDFEEDYAKKFEFAPRPAGPPYTGTGFSSPKVETAGGFMNMYPETSVNHEFKPENIKPPNKVQFIQKFNKDNADVDPDKPQGSTEVVLGEWDGKKLDVPESAEADRNREQERVIRDLPENQRDKILQNRVSFDRIKNHDPDRFKKAVNKLRLVEKFLRKKSDYILSKNQKLPSSARQTLTKRDKQKRDSEGLFNNRASRLRRDRIAKKRKQSRT